MLRAHKLADEGILGRPRFNMDDVLNEAKKTRYYFDVKSLLCAMQDTGKVADDGSFYGFSLLAHAEGRDCYDTIRTILGEGE